MFPHNIGLSIAPGGRPLRVGILANASHQPAWVCAMVRQIMSLPCVHIAGVFLYGEEPSPNRNWPVRLQRRLMRIYRRWVPDPYLVPLGPAPGPHADELEDAMPLWTDRSVRRIDVSQHDGVWSVNEQEASRLLAEQLDVIVLLGTDRWRGQMLTSARWGVWGVMPGDRFTYPGGPAGVWEVIEQQPSTSLTLEILVDESVAPQVLQRAVTASCLWSIHGNCNLMFWHSVPLAARTLRELWRDGEEAFTRRRVRHPESAPTARRFYGRPAPADIRLFVSRQQALIDREQAIDASMMRQWILLYDTSGSEPSTDLARFKRLAPPPDRVWADPFVVQLGSQHVVLFEEHILARKHAHLCAMCIEQDGSFSEPELVLERPYHLSYPFVFEHEGVWYMIPETRGNRSVELYRSEDFPRRWEQCRTLLTDVDAVDATLWREGERWWMYVGINENRGPYTWTDLHLYYADDPIHGEWHPHKLNPVVIDVRRSRPAGRLFRRDGVLYRPAQDGSVRYGYAIRILEVTRLTPDEYDEQERDVIAPTWAPDLCGVHTINHAGNITVSDARIIRPKTAAAS